MITLPSLYSTDVLNQSQLWFLASRLPQPRKKLGRKPYTNIELLPGILQVLRSGCRWRDLDQRKRKGDPSGVTHWRRLQFWKRSKIFPLLWRSILNRLRKDHRLNVQVMSIDGTFIPSYSFKDGSGYSGQYKKMGVKVANIVDSSGIPLTLTVDTGNRNDMSMAQPTVTTLPLPGTTLFGSTLLADRGYDSQSFRYFLHKRCIKALIALTKRTRKAMESMLLPPDENPEMLKHRFVVERTHAWMKSFRRLHFRYDRTKRSFEAFLYLAVVVICLRKLI